MSPFASFLFKFHVFFVYFLVYVLDQIITSVLRLKPFGSKPMVVRAAAYLVSCVSVSTASLAFPCILSAFVSLGVLGSMSCYFGHFPWTKSLGNSLCLGSLCFCLRVWILPPVFMDLFTQPNSFSSYWFVCESWVHFFS